MKNAYGILFFVFGISWTTSLIADEIKVLFSKNELSPMFYTNQEGEVDGIIPEILNLIFNGSGHALEYREVPRKRSWREADQNEYSYWLRFVTLGIFDRVDSQYKLHSAATESMFSIGCVIASRSDGLRHHMSNITRIGVPGYLPTSVVCNLVGNREVVKENTISVVSGMKMLHRGRIDEYLGSSMSVIWGIRTLGLSAGVFQLERCPGVSEDDAVLMMNTRTATKHLDYVNSQIRRLKEVGTIEEVVFEYVHGL